MKENNHVLTRSRWWYIVSIKIVEKKIEWMEHFHSASEDFSERMKIHLYRSRKTFRIAIALIKLTLSPFYHLAKSKKPAAQVAHSLLKRKMSIAPTATPASPLPDLVIDESDANRNTAKHMPNVVEEVMKEHNPTPTDTTPKVRWCGVLWILGLMFLRSLETIGFITVIGL